MAAEKVTHVVLITGSSEGIGAATARHFAANNFKVMVHGLIEQDVNAVVAECEKLSPSGHKMHGSTVDLSTPESGGILVEQTVNFFEQLDVLVLNAGVWLRTAANGDLAECWQNYNKLMNIHINSNVNACLHAIPHLKQSPKGVPSIVFIGSVAYLKPPMKGYFAFCSASAMQVSLAKTLALELAPHIRVNTVSVGAIFTKVWENNGYNANDYHNITLLRRLGTPDEVAKTIYFVATEANFLNGSDLNLDGGYHCNDDAFGPMKQQQ